MDYLKHVVVFLVKRNNNKQINLGNKSIKSRYLIKTCTIHRGVEDSFQSFDNFKTFGIAI